MSYVIRFPYKPRLVDTLKGFCGDSNCSLMFFLRPRHTGPEDLQA